MRRLLITPKLSVGGHTKGASYRTFLENTRNLGADEAIKIAQLEYSCMRGVHTFAREHKIDCDSRELDTVDVFYDQGQWDRAMEAIQLMRKLMKESDPAREYRIHTSEESRAKFLVPGAIGSIRYAAGSLSAYKFGVGVLKLALNKGLNLQTNTPALNIAFDKGGGSTGGWRIQTQRGTILTEKVVLASNGYTAHVYPRLLGTICPLRGQVTAHRAGTRLSKSGLANTYSFIYKDGYEYMIPRPQGSRFAGDIVIGGGLTKAVEDGLYEYGNTDDTSLNGDVSAYLRDTTIRYFGNNWGDDAQEGRIRKEWTGIMGYSPDGYPLVGSMPDEEGLYISASFQGHGMVLALLCARALTSIMLEEAGTELDLWFPKAFKVQRSRLALPFRGKVAPCLGEARPETVTGTKLSDR
jgi:glycine/D-amino acid oxidase-like deaminating enzyme